MRGSSGGSCTTAGNDVTANRGQWASPEEFSITVGGRYVRVKNQEFALPNRTIVIRASKSVGFRENREGWQPCVCNARFNYDAHAEFKVAQPIRCRLTAFSLLIHYVTL